VHVSTFATIVPPAWLLLPFVLMIGSILCIKAVESRRIPRMPPASWSISSGLLLAYFLITFAYVYHLTDGATSVNIRDGQYVSMYKDHIIRMITEREYRMFPNLWGCAMSAPIGSTAAAAIGSFRD
jgi:uncharacterized membrane protein